MEEFEDPQDSREGWEMMQRRIWAFIVEYTGKDMSALLVAFEKWAESKTQEEMDDIFSPEIDEETIERNLAEEGPLHTKDEILKNMWGKND